MIKLPEILYDAKIDVAWEVCFLYERIFEKEYLAKEWIWSNDWIEDVTLRSYKRTIDAEDLWRSIDSLFEMRIPRESHSKNV